MRVGGGKRERGGWDVSGIKYVAHVRSEVFICIVVVHHANGMEEGKGVGKKRKEKRRVESTLYCSMMSFLRSGSKIMPSEGMM